MLYLYNKFINKQNYLIIINKGSGNLDNNCKTCSGSTYPYFDSVAKKCVLTCPVKYYATGNTCASVIKLSYICAGLKSPHLLIFNDR